MPKKLLHVLGATAALAATLLTPAAASAATHARAANAPAAGDPNTTVTFTVGTGTLDMTAPGSADLGTGLPGTTIAGLLGDVTVTDNRALLAASWTVTASTTAFHNTTTGGGTGPEIIPATAASYTPGAFTNVVGTITPAAASAPPIALSTTAVPVVDGTAGIGDNAVTWDPTEAVAVPANIVGGGYTSVLTQSVS